MQNCISPIRLELELVQDEQCHRYLLNSACTSSSQAGMPVGMASVTVFDVMFFMYMSLPSWLDEIVASWQACRD